MLGFVISNKTSDERVTGEEEQDIGFFFGCFYKWMVKTSTNKKKPWSELGHVDKILFGCKKKLEIASLIIWDLLNNFMLIILPSLFAAPSWR